LLRDLIHNRKPISNQGHIF